MRKTLWSLIFLFGAPALIIWSFLALTWLTPPPNRLPSTQVLAASTSLYSASSLPAPQFSVSFTTADARSDIIANYLKKYASPLSPYSRLLVETSDRYNLDYRLLVAIAQQESNLCKKIPTNSHNCWGYGIYGDQVIRFDNYPQAIDTVARALKKNYIDIGLDTPEKIMAKYTPPSLEKGGPWAKAVSQFLSDLE